ncbi:ATP-binding protein [Streptomyces sp. WMMB 322]|uniref:sensor histidine kinase n=1 Tax=Streptomyces sp. WMMB 322 TaxID=1286821 RepID=UPI000823CF83|nr:ATP-binding protein [Streptomyces sp. WMMB 322]SCK47032.1 Signal transduction histidine kinase [Streptomyces sp. WMMB 322]
MVRAGSSPGDQGSGPVLVWLLPAVLTAAATGIAVPLVPEGARIAVAVCGLVATLAVAVVAAEVARRGRALASLRAEHAAQLSVLQSRLHQQERVTVQLAKEWLPEAVERLQEGEFAEDVLQSMPRAEGLSSEFQAAHQELLRSVVEAVQAEETLRDSAQRGVVNIARRVQAIVHRQATDLRGMEDRHGQQPDFFADLLRLDHGTALIGRLADSIAVLGGARPGRQWSKAVPVYSVLRGAMSRVLDYQRVELHSVADVAIVGPAVEPLIHALAELLDNATRYSPPKARVHLTAGEVHAGIAIEIEDGGVGLSEEARKRAELRLKEAQAGIDLNDLGESPRLGLAVVGRLAQAYDFQVSLPPSAYGGVRAVLVVPKKLVTTAPATGRAHGIGAGPGQETPRQEATRREAPAAAAPAAGAPAAGHGAASFDAPSSGGAPASVASRGAGIPSSPRSAGEEAPRTPSAGTPFSGAPSAPAAEAPAAGHRMPPRHDPWLPETGPARQEDEVQDETPPVVERNANGLPQRRRRTPNANASPGGVAGRSSGRPQPPAQPAPDEPAPGLWMADLQSGLSGTADESSTTDRNKDTSSDKGE